MRGQAVTATLLAFAAGGALGMSGCFCPSYTEVATWFDDADAYAAIVPLAGSIDGLEPTAPPARLLPSPVIGMSFGPLPVDEWNYTVTLVQYEGAHGTIWQDQSSGVLEAWLKRDSDEATFPAVARGFLENATGRGITESDPVLQSLLANRSFTDPDFPRYRTEHIYPLAPQGLYDALSARWQTVENPYPAVVSQSSIWADGWVFHTWVNAVHYRDADIEYAANAAGLVSVEAFLDGGSWTKEAAIQEVDRLLAHQNLPPMVAPEEHLTLDPGCS